jgi:hypothetical protein
VTLLCLSSIAGDAVAEGAVEVAGEVTLDAAADFAIGLTFGPAALNVGLGELVAAHAGQGDGVDGAVELAVAEPVPAGSARGHWDGCGA